MTHTPPPPPAGSSHPDLARPDLLAQPTLVVNQKARLIEVSNTYAILDGDGSRIGDVRQINQSTAKKILRLLGDVDQFLTHELEIVDLVGQRVLHIKRPRKVIKSRFEISDAAGNLLGEIRQENMIGKIRFALNSNGQTIGSLNAENWRAWNFSIRNHVDEEVARVTKTWEGLAKTMFTTADNYVVQIQQPVAEPLRSLVVAAALTIDTALKQDSRGFN